MKNLILFFLLAALFSSCLYKNGEKNDVFSKISEERKINYDVNCSAPQQVLNSENYYVGVTTQDDYASDSRSLFDYSSSGGQYAFINLIFLDKNYQFIGQLLDKKGVISMIYLPVMNYVDGKPVVDSTIQNIAYKIAFSDSNKNGVLDGTDQSDFYLSDLSGKNLTKVTQNDIEVISFDFRQRNSKIFFTYKNRAIAKDKKIELTSKFALYDIKNQQMQYLSQIDTAVINAFKLYNK